MVRLGAVHAAALASALRARDTLVRVSPSAMQRTWGNPMVDPMPLLTARAVLSLIAAARQRVVEHVWRFVTDTREPSRHDAQALWSAAVDRAIDAEEQHRQSIEASRAETARPHYQKRAALAGNVADLQALRLLEHRCDQLLRAAETAGLPEPPVTAPGEWQVIGVASGVPVRAALPAARAARCAFGDAEPSLEVASYQSMGGARRIPRALGTGPRMQRAFFSRAEVDRVDAILCILAQLPLPRCAAALASADQWLGSIVRDIGIVRQVIGHMPARDVARRRAAIVTLGLLGDREVGAHPRLVPDDALDVRVAAFGIMRAHLMPPMGVEAERFDEGDGRGIAEAEMIRALQALERRVREGAGPNSQDVIPEAVRAVQVAIQRAHAGSLFDVID